MGVEQVLSWPPTISTLGESPTAIADLYSAYNATSMKKYA